MVLAQRVQRDVPHHDHLVVVGLERVRMWRSGSSTPAQISLHAGDAGRRLHEAVTVRVLPDRLEDLLHRLLDPRPVDLNEIVSIGNEPSASSSSVLMVFRARGRCQLLVAPPQALTRVGRLEPAGCKPQPS